MTAPAPGSAIDRSILDAAREIPLYAKNFATDQFPLLEKTRIADEFPQNWMTPTLREALDNGAAQIVLSTGTNHARMQLIRPPLFLVKSYYELWSRHPDIAHTWADGCPRVSLTTMLATEHVARVGGSTDPTPGELPLRDRWLDERTCYLNQRLDPADWTRADVTTFLREIDEIRALHPEGRYHLDCSSMHLAHLVKKLLEWDMFEELPRPSSIIGAYEYTPDNVTRFLRCHFDGPIIDLFGSTELGYLYYSDGQGRYHPHLDRMQIELLPVEDAPGLFTIIVSSARNPYMPLIRYRSGDLARTVDGTQDPTRIARFCGREKELLRRGSGILCHGDLDAIISAKAPEVFCFQVRHLDGEDLTIDYTTFTDEPLSTVDTAAVVHALGGRTRLRHQSQIPIGRSGKYAWLHPDLYQEKP